MSNDNIIRSSKPHAVTIPEGSSNARSIRNEVGQRELEQEQFESIQAEPQATRNTVQIDTEALSDQRVGIEDTRGLQADAHAQVQEGRRESDRARAVEDGLTASDPVEIDTSLGEDNRVRIDNANDLQPHRVAMPPQEGSGDNLARIPSDTSSDNRVKLEAAAGHDHRVALEDEDRQDALAQKEGATSSEPVSVPADSFHDRFATTPSMTQPDSPPLKVDGHGITDPDRVIVEDIPDPLADVQVPVGEPEAPTDHVLSEEVVTSPVQAVAPADALATTPIRAEPAQVKAHLVDKKAEEFRGRVVKLRDEVDQLNRRLDEIEK